MTPILRTKLFIPSIRPTLVPRRRLVEQLIGGLHCKLTLISAPAGFGKTTLVAEWVNALRNTQEANGNLVWQVAWLSLDAQDNDLGRFLAYLVAALNQVEGIELPLDESPGALQKAQPRPGEAFMTALINELAAVRTGVVLVLDDYHVIETQSIHDALRFLVENLPHQLHLVITTREDPPFPLARLRARGELAEVRTADLRCTPDETAAFLNQMMGLRLSAEQIAALESRTEGWIAGLQLAAVSMRGQVDIPGFIKAFAGDNWFIVDYLVDEVLLRLPERRRQFLLQTSILDRLSGPLCDAVTGQTESGALLDALERDNLFLLALDEQRRWFRYHQLFADVLRIHLQAEQPDQLPILHRRASVWFERNGLPQDAIHHALAAQDFERAAALVELAWPEMDGRFQSHTWLGWANALPDELVCARPVLGVAYAWALLNQGEIEAGEARLRDAESWVNPVADHALPVETMVVADWEQFRNLPASIVTARCYIAQARGDIPSSIKYGRLALDLLLAEDYLRRGPAAALLGLAHWASGQLEEAYLALAKAKVEFQLVGSLSFALSITYGQADIRIAQGRLDDAIAIYEESLQLALAQGERILRGTADLYLGLGAICLSLAKNSSLNSSLE